MNHRCYKLQPLSWRDKELFDNTSAFSIVASVAPAFFRSKRCFRSRALAYIGTLGISPYSKQLKRDLITEIKKDNIYQTVNKIINQVSYKFFMFLIVCAKNWEYVVYKSKKAIHFTMVSFNLRKSTSYYQYFF